jgi:hypothetical protein
MTSHPSVNFTPRMIFGNWLWPSRRRQVFCAPSTNLNTMASAVLLERHRYSFIAVDFHHILLAGLPAHSLALRPAHSRGHLYVTCYTEGFSHFVTSMTAPVASGWSGWPGGACTRWKAPPCHGAHVKRTFIAEPIGIIRS